MIIALPTETKISPILLVRAIATKRGGAVRLWAIARMLDESGSGVVVSDDLKEALANAGVNRTTAWNWISEAIKYGFIKSITRSNSDKILILTGAKKAALILGVEHLDTPVLFNTEELLHGAWRTRAWEAHIYTTYNGKIISRKTLQAKTGIARQEQNRLEKDSKIRNFANIVETNLQPDCLTGFRENSGRKTAFVKNDMVCFRLPDTRTVPDDNSVTTTRRGRVKKINRTLNESFGSSLHGAGLSNFDTVNVRLFFSNDKKLERAHRKYGRQDKHVAELFLFVGLTSGNKTGLWHLVAK